MLGIKLAWKITSRFQRFPLQLINRAFSSVSKMPPTVKINDPIIDSTGKASFKLFEGTYA